MTGATRIPKAELTGVYGAMVKRMSRKMLGDVEYAEAMSQTPPAVTDELSARLLDALGAPALVDDFGRVATDLRVSVTDRCNLRCTYCMPPEGLDWLPKVEQLTDDEVVRLVRIGVEHLGIREVRFTGGEPLLRPGLPGIVAATTAGASSGAGAGAGMRAMPSATSSRRRCPPERSEAIFAFASSSSPTRSSVSSTPRGRRYSPAYSSITSRTVSSCSPADSCITMPTR